MKKLVFPICFALLVFVNSNAFAQKQSYPYTAEYSSNFAIGNPAHSKMILELWKDFEDNAFDRHNYMADTVVMYFPDGSMIKGKDSLMADVKKYRGSMKSVVNTIQAFIPLKSIDRNEDWVAVWGNETDTYADGKTETKELQEIWRINKDGKVAFMKQFSSMPTKQ